ncbi:MAG TPA: hypothetical protein VLT86_19430 [Vicinamibacterales bacterium]|nr:hypothetical protein [Vicinamibacterales bacterium]
MRRPEVSLTVGAALLAAVTGLAAQEASKQKPGIYLAASGTTHDMTRLVGAQAHSRTSGIGKTMLTQGISKPHTIASLEGTGADLRTKQEDPTFYFYFDANGSQPSADNPMAAMAAMMGGDAMPSGARTAADFVLVKMSVTKDAREVDMGQAGSQNTKSKAAIDCVVEKVAQGQYKVHAKDSLKPGEYAFYYNSPTGTGMTNLWDFGVDK